VGTVLNGEQKLRLIQEIAEGTRPYREIVESGEYGFASEQAIAQFKMRNREAIARAKADFENKLSWMWAVDKGNRIATYESAAEKLLEIVDQLEPDKVPNALKELRNQLRTISEELGQLNPKDSTERTVHEVRIVGVDTDQL
jgi:molecular chaperone GrpE (heat shock protein)